jgi:hypothetical protein
MRTSPASQLASGLVLVDGQLVTNLFRPSTWVVGQSCRPLQIERPTLSLPLQPFPLRHSNYFCVSGAVSPVRHFRPTVPHTLIC